MLLQYCSQDIIIISCRIYYMAILTIDVLKKLIENMPDDYTVEYDKEMTIAPITDSVTIDVSGERIILK